MAEVSRQRIVIDLKSMNGSEQIYRMCQCRPVRCGCVTGDGNARMGCYIPQEGRAKVIDPSRSSKSLVAVWARTALVLCPHSRSCLPSMKIWPRGRWGRCCTSSIFGPGRID